MKILAMYEGMASLFPKKVLVTLIHAESGAAIGEYKIGREQLPEVFNRPTTLDMGDRSWRIVKARPFLLEGVKKITLHVVEPTAPFDKFIVPTKSYPPSVLMETPSSDLIINISLEDWRQLELLPVAQLELIQEQITIIEGMLETINEDDGLLGYDTIHERIDIEGAVLNIPFDEFFQFVNGVERGYVQGVADSFVIRSENYQYYGIMREGVIVNLCLLEFDSAEDEFAGVVEKYELLLADWCNGKIIF
ncbi:hypothetical protein GFS24_21325 [Chitinophaga sp. SYP-B3965]|uniref:hypothetical protein n=1 Tax=Chitinophaga sp. SYP-B3965 TaxID=2663120 RepID=UPI001299A8ED|nr:hypothetical protein [Chitinophaga sp. SYP-B3965]MRG47679.1 hypothetical protein [Chitinophaga sp. SYP-B3965]